MIKIVKGKKIWYNINMETILTIDFDIIMAPSIELYDHLVKGREMPLDVIETFLPIVRYANADLYIYKIIINYLLFLKNKVKRENIIFIKSHEEVLNFVTELSNIINIDHHHDLGYNKEQYDLINSTCASWVHYGLKNNIINKYIWIKNNNSELYNLELLKNYINQINHINLFDINLYDLPIPDKIIICASFEWIPKQFRELFDIIEDILKMEDINETPKW